MSWNRIKILKQKTGVPVLILITFLLVWMIPHLAGKYRVWQFNNTHSNLSEEYIQDAYGGKTAEETHDLFLKAIKEEDIELASKYFVIEKQSDWLRILEEYERNNLLTGFIKELEETKNKGVFEKYPTGIWKISQL